MQKALIRKVPLWADEGMRVDSLELNIKVQTGEIITD